MNKVKNLAGIGYFLVLILVLTIYVHDNLRDVDKAKEGFTIINYLKNPQKYGDHKAESMAKIINISQDHFYINVGNTNLKVMGSGIRRPVLGETAVFLNYRKDGIIELVDYHNYNCNYVLYFVSFFAIIISIIIFFREWKITARGFKDA